MKEQSEKEWAKFFDLHEGRMTAGQEAVEAYKSEPSVLHEKQMAKFLSSCVPQLCWKLDRDIWAKVEAKEATTSWGREQSAIAICEAICDNGIGKCMKEQESQDKIWDEVLVLLTDHLFNPRPGNSSITVKMVNEMKSLYHINRRPK